jgi:hypothetical protein
MQQHFFPDGLRHSNRFARQRDERICWLLGRHPVTAAMLVQIGMFSTKNKALKRLRRLASRRRIRLVGTVWQHTGRPEHVYCRYRPKPDHLLHEIQLTAVCLRLDAGKIDRGPHVTDKEVRPDAEVWISGRLYYLELDRGSMRYAQIARRFRQYERCPHLSLWICATPERLEGMRTRAESLRHTALFTTFAEALATPHGDIWRDFAGGRAALPREQEGKAG